MVFVLVKRRNENSMNYNKKTFVDKEVFHEQEILPIDHSV